MALKIIAFKKIKFLREYRWGEDISDPLVHLYPHPSFKQRADHIPEGIYTYDEKLSVVELSYGGYNLWREHLAQCLYLREKPENIWKHPERYQGCPFVDLINYGDNEGFFGPKTAAKISFQFFLHNGQARDYRSRAPTQIEKKDGQVAPSEWFFDTYSDIAKTFAFAGPEGVVKFH